METHALRRRYGHARARSIPRHYAVEVDNGEGGDMEIAGRVTLPYRADFATGEAALSRIGVFAPRGLDRLVWHRPGRGAAASILDASGHPIDLLFEEN